MSRLLALDCSTAACSVALYCGDDMLERYEMAAQQHSQRLLPMIDELLAEGGVKLTQLDAIAFGRGPGSFTGLRIAVGMVQGLAFAADLPVLPVSSLAALAQAYCDTQRVADNTCILSAIDARMNEIYWGIYQYQQQSNQLSCVLADRLTAPACITEQFQQQNLSVDAIDVGVGTGWLYREAMALPQWPAKIDEQSLPRASAVARLAKKDFIAGKQLSAEQALPIYLRDQVTS